MSRTERARAIAADLRVQTAPRPSVPAPRYLLVQQYADAGRSIQHAVTFSDDVDALLIAAQREVWDGWLPTDVHDLDRGTSEAIKLTTVRDSQPHDQVTVVDVDGRQDPYLFRRADHAERFVDAVGAERCSTYGGLIVESDEADAVIDAEADDYASP